MSDGELGRRRGRAGVIVLGILTITSYGSWFYSFGVLIDPITADVGWSTTSLGLAFGAAQVITGVGAFPAGRMLDRLGGVAPFGVNAVVGGGLLLAATFAETALVFGVFYAAGAGIVGATGFYHVTTAGAARLRPTRPDRAIADLTLIGALASPLFIPLTAWMATTVHWRTAARVLALLGIAGALLATATVGTGGRSAEHGYSPSPLRALREAVGRPPVRRMLLAFVTSGFAVSAILVYQVPILTAAGASLGAAGIIGGLRGFFQIFGRMGLTRAVDRAGTHVMLTGSYLLGGAGVVFLLGGGVPAGIAFAVLAGVGFGASVPLQAIYARAHFDEADLGLLMALQGAVIGLAGGLGPVVGGLLHDLTSSWTSTILLTIALLAVSASLIVFPRPKTATRPRSGAPSILLRGWGSNPRPTD